MKPGRPRYPTTILCAPRACPHDPAFEHDNYFGCVPRDFSPTTGKSKSHHQRKTVRDDGRERWLWNGGCDAVEPQP